MSPTADHPTRRALTRGAAWAAPAVLLATAAPVVAASGCRPPGPSPIPVSGGPGTGWSVTEQGSLLRGYSALEPSTYSDPEGSIYSSALPEPGTSYEAVARAEVDVVAGASYTLRFLYNVRLDGQIPMTGFLRLGDQVIPGTAITTDRGRGIGVVVQATFTAAASTTALDVVLRITTPADFASRGSADWDAIRVYDVTLDCA